MPTNRCMFLMMATGFLAGAVACLAQETRGTIAGRVVDPSGAVVPGAQISAVHLATHTKTPATANAQGNYLLTYLMPGQYRIESGAAGFKRYASDGIEVRINDRLQLDIRLEVGETTESVTVSSETPLLQTADANVGIVVDQRRLADLPVLHGNPMLLMQISPSAVSVATNMTFLDTRSGDNARLTEYSIAGTPASTHEVTLDGVSNTTTAGGTSAKQRTIAFVPPSETVSEFKIDAAPFDAAVAASPSGLITITLKSGTNQLHGAARYFKTNPGWNANDFFGNAFGRPRSYLKNDHWVLAGNGPVYIPRVYDGRNRTFFMYGFERQHDDAPGNGGIFSVPPNDQRQGDFSALAKIGQQYLIYDPATAQLAAGRIRRTPFPNNVIPKDRVSPVASKLLSYFPTPRSSGLADGTQNFAYPDLLLHATYRSSVGKIDHNFSDRQRMFIRGYWGDKTQRYRDYFDNISTGLDNQFLNRGGTADYVNTLRPNLVLNARYGYTRFIFPHTPKSQGLDLGTLGFPAGFTNQLDKSVTSFPQIAVNGLTNMGNEKPDLYITNTHHFSGTGNYTSGSHIVRFGIDYRVYQENFSAYTAASPSFTFGSQWTLGPLDNSPSSPGSVGQGLASFLLGLPTAGSVGRDANYAVSSPLAGLFVQDDWRITRKLTLNLGLRWEVEGALKERFNRSVRNMDITAPNSLNAAVQAAYAKNPTPELPASAFQVKGGLLFAGVGDTPRGLFDTPKKNFAPRIGIAYQLDSKTVIRAGYGLFYAFVGQQDGEKVKQTGFSRATPFTASLDGGLTFGARLDQPFPGGILNAVGAADGLNTFLGNAVGFFNPRPLTPYNQRWSLTIQRNLPGGFLLEAGYVGNRGVHLEDTLDYKTLNPAYLSRSVARDQTTIDYWTARLANPFSGLLPNTGLSATVLNRDVIARMIQFPQFTGVTTIENAAFSWFHGLETRLERRFSAGYTIQLGYGWSKYMNALNRLNGQDSPLEKVIASADRPHRFSASGIYELPFGPGKRFDVSNRLAGRVIGGWQVESLFVLQTGPPLGFGNALMTGSIKDIPLSPEDRSVDRWFNPNVFNRATAGQLQFNYRTLPSLFSGVRADGRKFINASIIKAIPIRERLNAQLRGEFFNAVNHPNFAAPNTTPTSAAFGQITGVTISPRIVQLGLKVAW